VAYRVRQYRKGGGVQILEDLLKAIWFVIVRLAIFISLPFRLIFGKGKKQSHGGVLDRGFVNTKWQEIENLMRLGHPSNYARAVLEADKLLDHVLKSFRVPGMTMGDRLKASQNRFSAEGYNAAWQAHKVRNEIVHSATYELMDYSAKSAIENYKKAIDELV